MKANTLYLIFSLLMLAACTNMNDDSHAKSILDPDIYTVVFIGDSITYDGGYVSDIEAYLHLTHPNKKLRILNLGLPSETVSGLSEENHAGGAFPRPILFDRLESVLDITQPDFVFTNYGINDGIYKAFDENRFDAYKQGMRRLSETLHNRNIPFIHITPPIFDGSPRKNYADVVHKYADWLLSQVQTENWRVIDAHWPMQAYLDEQRKTDSAFVLARDGIHPNRLGHAIIADAVLRYLELKSVDDLTLGDEAFTAFPSGLKVLKIVKEKQSIMKDAWLTKTGHNRPLMKIALQFDVALIKENELNLRIAKLR